MLLQVLKNLSQLVSHAHKQSFSLNRDFKFSRQPRTLGENLSLMFGTIRQLVFQ